MKFLEMTVNALFDDRECVHLYVHNNRKIERGLPIKNYIYAFDNTDEVIKNIDLFLNDKDYLAELVENSLNFYSYIRKSDPEWLRDFRNIIRREKNAFKKSIIREKAYYLAVLKICKDNIKASLVLTRTNL